MLIELREACNRAGGAFVDGECVCPTEGVGGVAVRQTFDARFATCALPPSPGDEPCVGRGGFERVLDQEGMESFRNCLSVSPYSFRGLRLKVPSGWGTEDARPLAKWLDARFKPGTTTLNAKLSTPLNYDMVDVLIGSQSLIAPELHIDMRPNAMDPGAFPTGSPRVIHVRSVNELDWALGGSTVARPTRNKVPPVEAGALGRAIERAIAETHLEVGGATTVMPIFQRCLGMCDVRQDFALADDGPGLAAWRLRRYESGVLYSETLSVGPSDGLRVDGWVFFDLGGEPSLIARVERRSSVEHTVFAYDRDWNPLGVYAYDLLPDAAKASAVASTAAPLGEGEVGVVLCDTGITFDDDFVSSALLFGEHPRAPGRPGGSVLGWLAAAETDVTSLLDGVRSTALGIIPMEDFPSLHGASIARILLERRDPKLRVVSTSFERCLGRPDALRDLAAWDLAKSASELNKHQGRLRVVNLSAWAVVDTEACVWRFPAGPDSHYLWVTAAGNSGRRFTPEAPLARCPQALPNQGNVLVVAGSEGSGSPWPLSDVGSTYADLAADCTGEHGSCSGTSNSAPRVARTAALIVQRYGDAISNEMMRMAILFGVTVPSPILPCRSGGYLNHEDAMAVAATLVAQGVGQNKTLHRIDAERVLDGLSWSASYKLQKLDLLDTNGAFAK